MAVFFFKVPNGQVVNTSVFRDIKYTVLSVEIIDLIPTSSNLRCIEVLSKLYE